MAIVKMMDDNKCKDVEKLESLFIAGENEMVQSLWKYLDSSSKY